MQYLGHGTKPPEGAVSICSFSFDLIGEEMAAAIAAVPGRWWWPPGGPAR